KSLAPSQPRYELPLNYDEALRIAQNASPRSTIDKLISLFAHPDPTNVPLNMEASSTESELDNYYYPDDFYPNQEGYYYHHQMQNRNRHQ
ncbi:Hypothetical protein FKW44_025340, partial [Caligus rogercresseyi]